MDRDHVLHELIPYRLSAVAALTIALRHRQSWDRPRSLEIYFDKVLAIEGNSNAFTNPVIESGLIHCRALLEFLGLTAKNGRLQSISSPRRPDDIGIEDFTGARGRLNILTPSVALSAYSGDQEEAESALLSVFHSTNKGLAHFTCGFDASQGDAHLLEVASRGIPALVISHLYTPLGLPAPATGIQSRLRGTSRGDRSTARTDD